MEIDKKLLAQLEKEALVGLSDSEKKMLEKAKEVPVFNYGSKKRSQISPQSKKGSTP